VPSFAIILAGISLLIWSVLTFLRGAFWQLRPFDDDLHPASTASNVCHPERSEGSQPTTSQAPIGGDEPRKWPRIVAVLPARNEADSIARAVESLITQDYPGEFRIVVVDDHSQDDTASLAQKTADRHGASDRLTVTQAAPLQPGWTGKLWALKQGVGQAAAATDYFWFTDADITHDPDTLQRLVARADSQKLDLVSLMVLLQAKTVPERLLIPAFLYFFLKLYPPRWIADPQVRTAGAAGGCILLRPSALERIGGIAAIRGEVIDDCSLAAAVKRSGGAMWMGLTRKSVSLRAYDSFAEIRDLIARTAFTQLRYSGLLLLGTLLGMLLTYIVPVALVFDTLPLVWCMSFLAWALMTVTYLPTVRFYRLSPLWALLLPLAAAFYSYATCLSAVRYWLGRGGQWKGRAQASVKA
jgi:hopene-associated glycosyltransferase HpnB